MSVPVPPSKLIRKLSAYFGVLDIFEWVPFRAGDPPRPVQATGRFKCGSVRVAIFDYQTVLPLPRARLSIVKPFKQRELHGTVTICPELKILHSDSYAEIGADRLCTRTANVVCEFATDCARGL